MSSSNRKNNSGLGLFSVLQIIFIVLKLVGLIDWSWLWVLSPIWINLLLGSFILVIISIMDWIDN